MKKNKAIIVLLVMVLLLGGLSYTAVEGIGTEKAGVERRGGAFRSAAL